MTKTDFTDSFSSGGIHRRNFIKVIGVGAAGAAMIGAGISPLGPIATQAQTSPALSKYTEQLPIPGIVNAKGGGTFSLPMAPGLQRFHSALPLTPTWGYGGMPYLGPTFEVKRGVPITVSARNNLGAHPLAFAIDTTLHGAILDVIGIAAAARLCSSDVITGCDQKGRNLLDPRLILCLKNPAPLLETVSTTCGSGWVRSFYVCIEKVVATQLRTHPLLQVVLTVSKSSF